MPRSLTMPKQRIPSFTLLPSPKACCQQTQLLSICCLHACWGTLLLMSISVPAFPLGTDARMSAADHKHPQPASHCGRSLRRAAAGVLHHQLHGQGPPAPRAGARWVCARLLRLADHWHTKQQQHHCVAAHMPTNACPPRLAAAVDLRGRGLRRVPPAWLGRGAGRHPRRDVLRL